MNAQLLVVGGIVVYIVGAFVVLAVRSRRSYEHGFQDGVTFHETTQNAVNKLPSPEDVYRRTGGGPDKP